MGKLKAVFLIALSILSTFVQLKLSVLCIFSLDLIILLPFSVSTRYDYININLEMSDLCFS